MPRLNLTERTIAKLPAPTLSGTQEYHWDTGMRGFGVVCSGTSNLKTFVVQRDVNGKARRVKVASVAELPLAKARIRAAEMLDDLRRGIDPAKKADANMTLQAALNSYLAVTNLRAPSVRAYRMIERTLAPWLDLPLRNINTEMVGKKHAELGDKIGGHTANASLRIFRIVWNHAAEKVLDLPSCPTSILRKRWFKEERRQRMVAADQTAEFYAAVMKLDNAILRDAILLLMFTGMRRNECTSLSWENIDFKQRLIRLPAAITKTDRACDLPMSDFVFNLLVARRSLGKDRFIFPGPGKAGHVSYLQHGFKDIADRTGITISAHDLRRGFATVANSIGVPVATIKQLLNHVASSDVTLGYIIPDIKEQREATQKIATRLQELCGIPDSGFGNVTKIRQPEMAIS